MSTKIKLCSLLLLALLTCLHTRAQDNEVALIVELVDGTTQEYVIGDDPRVTIEGDNVLIKSLIAETQLPQQQVERFYFSLPQDIPTAVGDVKSKAEVMFAYDGTAVQVSGAGQTVQVYDLNGRMVRNVVTHDGAATIDVTQLVAGVYIIKTTSQTIKILKK